jgi:hypothetical protein
VNAHGLMSASQRERNPTTAALYSVRDTLAWIGLLFVVFSLVVMPTLRECSDKQRADALQGLLMGVWLIAAFCAGLGLLSAGIASEATGTFWKWITGRF